MKLIKWLLLGAVMGFAAGKLVFRSNTAPISEHSSQSESILQPTTASSDPLTLPMVQPINLTEAQSQAAHPPLSGSLEEVTLHLGMIQLAAQTPDILAITDFFNNATAPGELRDLATSVFEQLAMRDPKAAYEAAKNLDDASLQRTAQAAVMETWAKREPEIALSFIDKLELNDKEASRLYYYAFEGYVRSDPVNAMRRLEELQLGRDEIDQMVTSLWVYASPDEALAWIQALDESPRRSKLLAHAAGELATEQPSKALEIAMSIPDRPRGTHPAHDLLYDLAALPFPGSADKAVGLLHELPDELVTDGFVTRLASHAILGNPDRGVKIADELPQGPIQQAYWAGVVRQFGWNDPVRAAELVTNLDEGPHLADAYESVMNGWTKTDEFAAAEWLANLEPSPSKDQAIETFSEQLMAIDAERAVQWASSIDDPNRRAKHLEDLVAKWKKVDPEAAREWSLTP